MRKSISAMLVAAIILAATSVRSAEAPLSVAGFTLGQPIKEYGDRVYMETALPVRYMENLREVEIVPQEGFKSGLISFGTCRKPGTIVRIKLKYADGSLEFYEELLKRFKQKFGEPDQYQGDAFRVFISWKWLFTDSQHNRISMILQHNSEDEEEKIGNVLKLTLPNQLEEDARCFREQEHDRLKKIRQRTSIARPSGESQWSRFIPN
ncbi:MAG: hypothetical protein ACM3KE_05765 [Hyphomicrobiales bacterium]